MMLHSGGDWEIVGHGILKELKEKMMIDLSCKVGSKEEEENSEC